MEEKVIFSIDFADSFKQISDVKNAIADLKKENKELQKSIDDGTKSREEATEQIARNETALRELTTEQRNLQKAVDNTVKANKAEKDSIAANRAELARLTAEYIKIGKPTKDQTDKIKALSDKLKEQEGVIGDTRRNVGNYADALKGLPGGLGKAVAGVQGFNTALKANPIGAVVGLLFQLLEAFKSNATVADGLSFIFGGLNKVFGFITDTIVTTVSSFDNLTTAIKNPIKFIKDFVNGAIEAGQEGFDAAKKLDEFTLSSAKLANQIKKNDVYIDTQTKALKDRTKTEQERIKLANDIAEVEIINAKLSAQRAQEELDAEKLRLKGRTLSAAEQAKLSDLVTEVEIANEQKKTIQKAKQTRINILLEKEEKKALQEIRKEKTPEEIAAEEKKKQDDLAKIRADALKKQLDDNKLYFKEQETIEKENYANGLITEEEYQTRLLEIKQDSLLQELDILQSYGEAIQSKELELQNARLDQQIEANKKKTDEENEQTEKEKEILEQRLQDEKDIQDAKFALANATQQALGSLLELFGQQGEASAKFGKALALFQIGIDAAKAVATTIANATQSASATGPAAIFTQAAYIATGVASVLGAIAQAKKLLSDNAPKAPKFAEGVIGLQGAGTETSDSIDARLSKGESVITARATRRFAPILAQMEMAVGNKPNYQIKDGKFADGFIDGGFASRQLANVVNQRLFGTDIENALRNFKPVVQVSEINRVNKNASQTVQVSEL